MVTLTAWITKITGGLEHTYVTADNGDRWGCFGESSGGVQLFHIRDADFECAIRASEADGNAGIIYGISGIDHQVANRILLAGTPLNTDVRFVGEGTTPLRMSLFAYSTYGAQALAWAKRHNIESKLYAAHPFILARKLDHPKEPEKSDASAFGLEVLVEGVRQRTLPPLQVASLIIPDTSLIIPARRVAEGILVQDSSLAWTEMATALMSDWNLAYQISSDKWEELIAGAFKKARYDDVVLTPRSGDFGRDVIAIKNGIGCVKINVSVKAYKPDNLVRYNDVRALAGVILADVSVSKGIIATTSDFPPRLAEDKIMAPLLPHRLELMNGLKLKEWIHTLAKAT